MQIKICDICGERTDNTVSYVYDRRMDAAGSMEDVCFTRDLCFRCELKMIKIAINKYLGSSKTARYEFNKILADLIPKHEGEAK